MNENNVCGCSWQVPDRNFNIELSYRDDVPVLTLSGEIDVYTFPTMLKVMEDLVAAGNKHIVLDFYEVIFLDSGGISALIRVHKQLKGMSGRLDIERVHGHAYRVLEITGLIDILNIQKPDSNLAA